MAGRRAPARGFTLIELLVVQAIMIVIFIVLFFLYTQSRFIFQRGTAKIEMQQNLRQALIRIIPYIASANPRPADPPDIPFRLPAVKSPPPPGDDVDPEDCVSSSIPEGDTDAEIVLRASATYIDRIMRVNNPVPFNPRDPYPDPSAANEYRLFYILDPDLDMGNPDQAPGGKIGRIMLDRNTPGDPTDDIMLARSIFGVSFETLSPSAIDVGLVIKKFLPKASGAKADDVPEVLYYSTRVHLPIYTNLNGPT
jgi:hypothetical protein